MRQYIIKQMHKRIMNADETANLEYPQWKRRSWVVSGFIALRLWSIISIAMIPLVIIFGLLVYIFEAVVKIVRESIGYIFETIGANYRNLIADVRGCTNIWKGEYGRGKLLLKRPEMRINNPAGKPTRIPG